GTESAARVRGTVQAEGQGAHGVMASGILNEISVDAGASVTSVDGWGVCTPNGLSTVTNHGHIGGGGGAIWLGAQDAILEIGTGSTTDGLVGGEGSNLLRLIGSGVDVYDGSFLNFQTLDVNAPGGTWTLTGDQGY